MTWKTRISAYENITLYEKQAAHLLLGLIDNSGLPARDFYNVIQCWRNPENAAERTSWTAILL
jgi:hypothetical protein